MKIALCYSGQTRNFFNNVDSHKKYLIEPLNPDIFIHTWSFRGTQSIPRYYDPEYDINAYQASLTEDNKLLATDLLDIFQPKKILIEYPNKNFFIDKIRLAANNRLEKFNVLMMYYGIYASNKLKFDFEKDNDFIYDIVIRARFDTYFEKLDFGSTFNRCVKDNTIFIPPHQNIGQQFTDGMLNLLETLGNKYMPNDQFAYSSSAAMDYYCALYDKLCVNINTYPLHGEGALSAHLWDNNTSPYTDVDINTNILMKLNPW